MLPWNVRFAIVACLLLAGAFAQAVPVEVIPSAVRGGSQPQVAVAPKGKIHIAFGKGTAIYHTVSSDQGRTFSPPVQIADVPKLALGMRRGPRIAATDSVVTVSAISHAQGNLHTWTSKDGGATWSQAKQINTVANSAREGLHAMAGNGNGATQLVWLDLRNGGMELWSAMSSDGGITWGENTLVYHSPGGHICECCHPSVAVARDGRVVAMWRNWLNGARDMYLAQSNDEGRSWSAGRKLGEGEWKLDACPMDGGGVAFRNNEPVTVWRRDKSIYMAQAHGPETHIAQGAFQPVPFVEPSGTGVLWQAGSEIWIKRGDNAPVALAGNGSFPTVAEREGAGPVIVWEGTVGAEKTIFAEVLTNDHSVPDPGRQ